jgi:hypothetical protein
VGYRKAITSCCCGKDAREANPGTGASMSWSFGDWITADATEHLITVSDDRWRYLSALDHRS